MNVFVIVQGLNDNQMMSFAAPCASEIVISVIPKLISKVHTRQATFVKDKGRQI
jgi:hypothetical protein